MPIIAFLFSTTGTAPAIARPRVRFADGATLVYSPTNQESAQNPAFSPDGKTLLFTVFTRHYNVGPASLILLRNGAVRTLVKGIDADNVNLPGSSWNAATGLIAFASDRAGAGDIWTIAPNGSHLTNRVHINGLYLQEPTFSPDGSVIIFKGLKGDHADIYKVRRNGTGLKQLTRGADCREANHSPTSNLIVTQCQTSDGYMLRVMTDGGHVLRQLTQAGADATDASWSPDGKQIVYSGATPLGASLFVIGVDGSAPIRLTTSRDYDGAPSWSPDGSSVVFETTGVHSAVPAAGSDLPTKIMRIAVPLQHTAPHRRRHCESA